MPTRTSLIERLWRGRKALLVPALTVLALVLAAAVIVRQGAQPGPAPHVELMALNAPAQAARRAMPMPPHNASIMAPSLPVTPVTTVPIEPAPAAAAAPAEEPIAVEPAPVAAVPAPTEPSFDHRPLRRARTIEMEVTGYSPDARSCGIWADGITASGLSVWTNGMRLVAADTKVLPFRSVITVPGYNDDRPVPVLDRGGAIKGNRLDLLFPTHEEALAWGRKKVTVTVWEYAD